VIRRVLAGALTLVLPVTGPAKTSTVPVCPAVVGHRAGGTYAPENTLPGITATAQQGATVVEMDVQWSSSSFPVLMHDATVDRTTNGTGAAATLGLGQLTALWAADYQPWRADPQYADTRVPYAGDFMPAAARAGLDVILDIHATPTEVGMDKLAIYIDRADWRARTVVMGSPAQVTAMHGWHPELRYALIEYPAAGMIRTGESVRATGATVYVVPFDRITPAAVTYWKSYGLDVYTWTSDRPEWDVDGNWRKVTTAGVDAIVTNRPAALKTFQLTECGGGR
jgi:glycerophosphoryl diester phosphodiesterase